MHGAAITERPVARRREIALATSRLAVIATVGCGEEIFVDSQVKSIPKSNSNMSKPPNVKQAKPRILAAPAASEL
jgi:hypothetical protein